MIHIKPGVIIEGLQPAMYFAACLADLAYADEGAECIVTAALDGAHSSNTLHSLGLALDLSNHALSEEQHANIYARLCRLERYGFDVIDEVAGQTGKTTAPHFHIEFQPKPGERQSIFC